MNPYLKNSLFKAFRIVGGFGLLRYRQRRSLKILMYHRFISDNETKPISLKYPSSRDFEKQLDYLIKRFKILPLETCIRIRQEQGRFPERSLAITVDDGYQDFYLHAYPALKSRGLSATVFVVTDFIDKRAWLWQDKLKYCLRKTDMRLSEPDDDYGHVDLRSFDTMIATQRRIYNLLAALPKTEREVRTSRLCEHLDVSLPAHPPREYAPLTWEQIREMARNGIGIGAHTCSHQILPFVSPETVKQEVTVSRKLIEEMLGKPVETFCYPNNQVNDSVRGIVAGAGYLGAVAGYSGPNGTETDVFRLSRIGAPKDFGSSFLANIYRFPAKAGD